MSPRFLLLPLVSAALAVAARAQTPAQPGSLTAKLTETPLGARTQRIYLSDDGEHLAIVAPKGSRQVVLLDGVEGPLFDDIPTQFPGSSNLTVQWSPTGGRSGYLGRRGGDVIAVIDGKEAGVVYNTASPQGMAYSDVGGWTFWFNQDGSRLAYAAYPGTGGPVMIVDGTASPSYKGLDLKQVALNGKHLFYVAKTPDDKWHLVADGKPGPAYQEISSLKVTADGAHYAYLATKERSPTAPTTGVPALRVAVIDGVEGKAYPNVADLEQAPDGRAAYVATKPSPPNARFAPTPLVVGSVEFAENTTVFGTLIPGSGGMRPLRHVAWSPDGKRFAYIKQNYPNPGVQVMVNDQPMGLTYSAAAELLWSPDGAHLAYQGTSNTGTFPVIDGQELNGYNWIKQFQWSSDGKRYAFQAANNTGNWIVIDGKEQPKTLGYTDESLSIGPGGKHVVYGAAKTFNSYQPIFDGDAKPFNLGNFAGAWQTNPRITFPVFVWSPDGEHLAFIGMKLDGTSRGAIVVDGVPYEGPTPSYMFPSFSPDSKHWAAMMTTGRGWTVMLDGKLTPLYDEVIPNRVEALRFVDNHTYRFYGVKGGQIYRVKLDIGG